MKKAKRFTKRILASVLMLLILMSVSLTGLASVSAADCDVAQSIFQITDTGAICLQFMLGQRAVMHPSGSN